MFANDEKLRQHLYYSHNFGHNGPIGFHGLGINGKISELQAAMGLAVFPYMNDILESRKEVVDYYNSYLNFDKLQKMRIRESTEWNYSYYPVIFESEQQLLQVQKALNDQQIFPRRYFFPSLNTIEYVKGQKMPVSEDISSKILCLPLYKGLDTSDLEKLVRLINTNLS